MATKRVGFNGTTKGKVHLVVNQREPDDDTYDAHLGTACGLSFDGFLIPAEWNVVECKSCQKKENS